VSSALPEGTQEQRLLPDIQVNDSPLRIVGQQALAALTRQNDNLVVPSLYVPAGSLSASGAMSAGS